GRQVVTFTPKELLAMLDDFTARRDIAAGAGFGTPVRWSFQSATTGGGSISPAEWVSS
ncbi:hypothetical protein HAU05_26830, partial [Klebsiella variicola]|nr:hypothetical protein [Klebsiella variicola]